MGLNMRKYSSQSFLKVADVRDGPLLHQIGAVREGKFDKPELVFETGDILSLNATNTKTLIRAFGSDSDGWIGKQIELYLGKLQYQGSTQEGVIVRPISLPVNNEHEPDAPESPSFNDKIPF
jgi:hypothetical protein